MSQFLPSSLSSGTEGTVRCLAFDFGAGSSRAMLGCLDAGGLSLTEVHRFDSETVLHDGQTCWNIDALYAGLEAGLRKAQALGPVHAIGIDSWGVDFGLLSGDGRLLAPPLHYRNGHGSRGVARGLLTLDEMHRRTGAQRLELNTVFQLIELAACRPEQLAAADAMLMMADLFCAHLTGRRRSEYTLASTSGLFDVRTGDWQHALIAELGLPAHLFQPIVRPGEIYGELRPPLRDEVGRATPVFAVGAHDTASAVAGLDLQPNEAFLILGSWSLLGVEMDAPVFDARTLAHGFGNEGGVCGTHRLISNTNGLFLIQALREAWARRHGHDPAFADITAAAESATLPVAARIDPTDRRFFAPDDMMIAVDAFFDAQGRARPTSLGEYALTIYRGLADQIAAGVATLERVFGRPVTAIRASGGGSQDRLLCACIEAATGKPLRHGPIEASAYGNVLMQLYGMGRVGSLAEARQRLGRRQIERA